MRLNQVIAIEKGVKARVYAEVTELHQAAQKPDLFNGFVKQYRKRDEEGEEYPPERKRVQMQAQETVGRVQEILTALLDMTATKDWANCHAKADVQVGTEILVQEAPVPYLLFLEKQLTDLRTFVEKLPTLDEAEDWQRDEHSGLYKTGALVSTPPFNARRNPI